MRKSERLKHIFALLTVTFWSLAFIFTKTSGEHFTPEAIAFLRYFTAAVLMLAFAAVKKLPAPAKADIPLFLLGGFLGFAGYVYVFNIGLRFVTASVSSFTISSSPIITAVLARLLLKERIGMRGLLSIALSFAGVGIITLGSSGADFGAGMLWTLVSALFVSLYNIFQRIMLRRYKPEEVTTYCIVAGAAILLVFSPAAASQIPSAPARPLLSVVAMGILPSAIAYLCWANALSRAKKTSEVTNYMFLTPLLTTFLGFAILGEPPQALTFLGGVMILFGVILVNTAKKHTSSKK